MNFKHLLPLATAILVSCNTAESNDISVLDNNGSPAEKSDYDFPVCQDVADGVLQKVLDAGVVPVRITGVNERYGLSGGIIGNRLVTASHGLIPNGAYRRRFLHNVRITDSNGEVVLDNVSPEDVVFESNGDISVAVLPIDEPPSNVETCASSVLEVGDIVNFVHWNVFSGEYCILSSREILDGVNSKDSWNTSTFSVNTVLRGVRHEINGGSSGGVVVHESGCIAGVLSRFAEDDLGSVDTKKFLIEYMPSNIGF